MKSRLFKIAFIACLLILNTWFLANLNLKNSDIDGFFPSAQKQVEQHRLSDYRFLFVHASDENQLTQLKQAKLVDSIYQIPNKNHLYLLLFNKEKQPHILSHFSDDQYMGSPIIGALLSEEFLQQTIIYLLILIPFLIPFIIWLVSSHYLATISMEALSFMALILGSIYCFNLSLNPAYLLSLLFILLYAFTTINQIHLNEIETKPLSIGIAISLFTTWISALLLSFSQFGIISDFGKSLMIWLLILSAFIAVHLYFSERTTIAVNRFQARPLILKVNHTGIVIVAILLFSVPSLNNHLSTQFNPLLQSAQSKEIEQFEAQHILSQPILIEVSAKDCHFLKYECNKSLFEIQNRALNAFPVKVTRLSDLGLLYEQFTLKPFVDSSASSFAQFKLALEMSEGETLLYSADYKTAYLLVSVSLLTPIEELVKLNQNLQLLSSDFGQGFDVTVYGRLKEMISFQQVFFTEMWLGISLVLIILLTGITLLYKDIKANISLLPALLTLMSFSAIHWWLDWSFTVMSLVALILFVGLIADNIIHILMAYRTHPENCFKLAFKPIFLSNFILIISFSLVLFLEMGFLRIFGLEMALLLTLNLALTALLLPNLLRWTLPVKNPELIR